MAIDLVARLSLQDNLSGPLAAINSKLAGMVGFAAVTAGVGSAVKSFADFDTEIRKAATIAGATDAEFTAMAEAAKDLGASTSLSASEVAGAMSEMSAKGYSAMEVIDAMPGVISAAEASSEDLALTADTVSSALNAWSMKASEASDVADVLAMTANMTSAGIDDMQYTLKYAGATAKNMGMSLEEVATAAGLLADQSIEGSTAGTSLRQGLSSLAAPTKTAAKLMDQYGFSAEDSNGKIKSMADIVGDLKDSMNGMTQAQKVNYLKTLVGTEAMNSFLILTDQGPEKFKKMQKALENSGGASAEAAEKMKAGIGGALSEASGAIDTFKINVGAAFEGPVRAFAKAITDFDTGPMVARLTRLGDTFTELANKVIATNWDTFVAAASIAGNAIQATADFVVEHFTAIATAAKIAGTAMLAFKAVNVVIAVVNGVIGAINGAVKAVKLAKKAFDVLKTTFLIVRGLMMMFPGAWIAAAIMAVIAAGVALYKNWDTIKQKASELWANIRSGEGAFGFLKPVVDGAISLFVAAEKKFIQFGEVLAGLWSDLKSGEGAFSALKPAIDWIKNAFETVGNVFNKVKTFISDTWQRILDGKSSVLLLMGPLGWLVQIGVEIYRHWDILKAKASEVWSAITEYVGGAVAPIADFIAAAGEKISYYWGLMTDAASKLWSELKTGERSFASILGPVGMVIDVGVKLYRNWDKVKAGAAALWKKIELGKGAFAVLKVAIAPVKFALGLLIGTFKLVVKAVASVWTTFNKQGPAQMIKTALNNVRTVAGKVKAAFDALKSGVSHAMQQARIAVTDSINGIIDKVNWLIEKLNAIPGVNVPLIATVEYRTTGSVDNKQASVKNSGSASAGSTATPIGNHGGWSEIRTDGTLRSLHAGERVLTAVENDSYKSMMSTGLPKAINKIAEISTKRGTPGGIVVPESASHTTSNTTTTKTIEKKTEVNPVFNFNGITVREEADIRKIADVLVEEIKAYV